MPKPKCYPAKRSAPLAVVGYALLIIGIITLFACIPCWAWLALVGVALIALGWIVIRLSNAWR